MVLVDAPVRRRGLASALLRRAIEYLDGRGVRSMRLDATSLGQPLYEKFGFAGQYRLVRFQGLLPGPTPAAEGLESLDRLVPGVLATRDAAGPLHLDRQATGTDRRKLLERLFAERPEVARVVRRQGRVRGYLTTRDGASAVQIGPCIAEPEAGKALLAQAWEEYGGRRVYVDIPLANSAAVRSAESRGLSPQREFLRMCRGEQVQEDLPRLWASSGPENG
jgi:hypothetical protein